jgi:hypothetical protein
MMLGRSKGIVYVLPNARLPLRPNQEERRRPTPENLLRKGLE